MAWLKLYPTFSVKRFYLLAFLFFLTLGSLQAQDRCATVDYNKALVGKNQIDLRNGRFEKWLKQKIASREQTLAQSRTETPTYIIPVVVHVIHNGEAVGTGSNISDAQIRSQIEVLNNDFKRLNTDTLKTPTEFKAVAGSMNITFIMAKQNPSGLSTTGINRVKGTQSSWSYNDDATLKALSYWPAEDYFNIWVCKLSGSTLGYTQFPFYNMPGIEDPVDQRLTDGVVIGYSFFGSSDYGNFTLTNNYDKGRTLTHEAGHFFGLRHIWGDDGNCSTTTDWVDDTPKQIAYTSGCPAVSISNNCAPSVHKMYSNYLDYTDDACMNLFTQGQVTRMITVLENATRRASLLTSHGLLEPTTVANDLGISRIISPAPNECSNTIVPTLEIRNNGKNQITSTRIQLKINSILVETIDFSLQLDILSSDTVSFSPQYESEGNATFAFEILQTNGVADGTSADNSMNTDILVSDRVSTPFAENFNNLPANWIVQNPDQLTTWQIEPAPFTTPENTAAVIQYYNTSDAIGNEDVIISPPFNLSLNDAAFLSFDLAYARNQTNNDGLRIIVLSNCSMDLTSGSEIFNQSGESLATAFPTGAYFIPAHEDDWKKIVIDLQPYKNLSNIRIAFVGTNGAGNNIYLDNVSILTSQEIDLALTHITNPVFVTCTKSTPSLTIENIGTLDVTSFTINTKVNSDEVMVTPITGVLLKPGDTYIATVPALKLSAVSNTIAFSLSNVNNGNSDINSSNDQLNISISSSDVSRIVPFRENFNKGLPAGWSSLNPADGMTWALTNTNYSTSLYFNGYDDVTSYDQAWLISPLLDFTNAQEASMFFDRSYALNPNTTKAEQLRVVASVGCGNAFTVPLYDKSGTSLANTTSTAAWHPSLTTDWVREYTDLSAVAGKKDVRLAFVANTGPGNNLFIDNLEFFNSSNPAPIILPQAVSILYDPNKTVDFFLNFNLEDQQAVDVEIIDLMGKTMFSTSVNYTLNQNYPVTVTNASTGVYVVRVHTTAGYYIQKVIIQK